MRTIIDFKTAILVSITLLGMLTLFHIAILIGILFFDYVPIDYLWGGKLKTDAQLLNFEIVSLLISVLLILLLLIRSKQLNLPKLSGVIRLLLWIVFVFFLFNTIGNTLSSTIFERWFAIFTGVLALLFFRIAIEKSDNADESN